MGGRLVRRLVAVSLVSALGFPAGCARPEPPPNIVLVVTDDGPTPEDLRHLPGLRRMLFEPGLEFDTFLTPNPMCCPSRASTLRGQYCQNTGVLTNQSPDGGLWAAYRGGIESEMLPVWLERAGYATALFGKYLNGYMKLKAPTPPEHVPPGWTEWYGGLVWPGYEFQLNVNGEVVRYPERGPHANDVLKDFAVDFIRRRASAGPMFLLLSTGSPHEPAVPAHRHEAGFEDVRLPRRPNFNEDDVSDKPAWVRRLKKRPASGAARLRRMRDRLRSMLSVEDLVAGVLGELEAQGVLGRTYVFFFVDNGFHYGEHRVARMKGTPYEESVRVLATVRGPGIPRGAHRAHLAANHDLAPTFLELAGAPRPALLDGRSLVPLLGDTPPALADWRQAVSLRYVHHRGKAGNSPSFTGLRLADRKYVRYETGEEEYYDLAADPFELRSLHGEEALAPALGGLRAWSDVLGSCAGEDCRRLEMAPP